MSNAFCQLRERTVRVLAVVCAAVCTTASADLPDFLFESDQDQPVAVCGKGQAMAERFRAGQAMRESGLARIETYADTDAIHYELDIEVSDIDLVDETCTITGSNRMTIRSKSAALTEFTFRLVVDYAITSALLNDTTPAVITTEGFSTQVVTLDRTYGYDEEFTLTIEYTGTSYWFRMDELMDGPIVASLSQPWWGFLWWPAKDCQIDAIGDNTEKVTMEFSITVPDNLEVPSNGVLQSIEALPNNRARYNWASNYPIMQSLVSFAAADYNTWSVDYVHDDETMPVEFYIYPEWDFEFTRAAWENVVDMIGVFADVYGEYPFVNEKYGIYNFPFGGGMEHQTMTGQGGSFAFDEDLTAHEVAHSWWGDALSCGTWSDIWISEGFATYSECLWAEFGRGTPNPAAYFEKVQEHRPFQDGANGSVYVYPEDINDGRLFDRDYSYYKGAWVVHQLRGVVGDVIFFDILADFRAAYLYSAATTDDLSAIASAAYGQDLSWFFDQTVYGMGAPAYEYGWANTNSDGQDYLHVNIAQVHDPAPREVFIMPVDLVVTIGGSEETITVWNDQRVQQFVVPVTGPVTALQFDPNEWILRVSAVNVGYPTVPAAPEAGGPACATAGDCTDAWAGADCVAGACYVPKNRHLSIDPTINESMTAYLVTVEEAAVYPMAEGRHWWVDEPVCYDYPNGDPVLPPPAICVGPDRFGWVSSLAPDPVLRYWTESPLHLTDCGIVPAVTYGIRTSPDGGETFSDPLMIATAHDPEGDAQSWGDITGGPVAGMPGLWLAPERATNFGDVGNAIRTFENRSDGSGYPPRVWVDVEINQVVNFGDISFVIKAFEGTVYADLDLELIGVDPADCP